jgi:hypothetical protein
VTGTKNFNLCNLRYISEYTESKNSMEQSFPDSEREVLRTKQLRQICEEFALLAAQVGKMIISELFVDLSQKKIPPITDRYVC